MIVLVQPTLAGFGNVVAVLPNIYSAPENAISVNVADSYSKLYKVAVGEEIAYSRHADGRYWAVDPL